MEIGTTIKKLREQKKLSVMQLAKKTQLSRQTIYELEKGHYSPGINVFLKIIDALECPIAYFFELASLQKK